MNRKRLIATTRELVDVVGTRVVMLERGKTTVKIVEDIGQLAALHEALRIKELNNKLQDAIKLAYPSRY